MGLDVLEYDAVNEKVTCIIPKDGYNRDNDIKDPGNFARRVKDTLIKFGVFSDKCKILYKVSDKYFTEEIRKDIEKNSNKYLKKVIIYFKDEEYK